MRHRGRLLALGSLVASGGLGCSGSTSPFLPADAQAPTTGVDAAARDAALTSQLDVRPIPIDTASGNGSSNCSTAATLVYVLSTDNQLYSFNPGTQHFALIGTIGCNPSDGSQPNSMAIDREANAWVNYVASDGLGDDSAGTVYKVSTVDGSCAATPSVTLPPSWYRLGMGFSTDASGGTAETLYVTGTGTLGGGDSPGLASIDLGTFALNPIGQFTGDGDTLNGQSAELTGTGDGRLFGFFTTTPIRVAQINKTSGAVLSDMAVNGVMPPSAWAFSFWGGAFYLYTSDGLSNSTVTRFNPTTMAVDSSYVLTAPAVIVGAGVSTCAPLLPPS